MSRQATILAAVLALLVAVAFYFFVFQPGQEELADVESQIEGVVAQQATTQTRIAQLEAIRSDAAAIEAAIAGATAIVPSETALPATLREIQAAADDSGIELLTLAPSTPGPVTGADELALAQMSLPMSVEGSYFQVVDFLRRIEDPELVARGVIIDAVTVSPGDYPTLSVTITARVFANVVPGPDPAAPPPAEEPADDVDGDTTDTEDAA